MFTYRRKLFYPYIIQISQVPEVLFVNYATNIDDAFADFGRKHPRLKHASLRTDLFNPNHYYKNSKQADQACHRLISSLEPVGFEFIAGGPLMNRYWQVYVIQIDGNPKHLYVGETNYPVEKRFQQHIYEFNPARQLLRYDHLELAMHHATHLPRLTNKPASLRAEAQLAQQLKNQGFKVAGGH